MKKLLLPCFLVLLFSVQPSRAMIVYSGIQDLPIPFNPEGAYLQIESGATSAVFPLTWSTAPWLNPFFGGVYMGNSPLLRPVITGTDQILNLAPGVTIGSWSNFVSGESGSTTHVGGGPGQFALNVPGYLGFTFASTAGGPDHYGWLQIEIHNTGPGKIISWAYEDITGAPIDTGAPVVPEPGLLALLGLAAAGLALQRRRG